MVYEHNCDLWTHFKNVGKIGLKLSYYKEGLKNLPNILWEGGELCPVGWLRLYPTWHRTLHIFKKKAGMRVKLG